MDSVKFLQSYVWNRNTEQCYFISTIERDSSAMADPPQRFHETIAWEYDYDKRERGKMVAMEGVGGPWSQHIDMCRQLAERGEYALKDY